MALKYTVKVIGHLSLLCAFVTWYVVYTSVGFAAISQDSAITTDKCGQESHMMKYTTINSVFATLILISYAIFPGGGEGARARAMLITIIHGTLAMWGVLMEMALPDCMGTIESKFNMMYVFHKIALYHNMAFFTLMLVHEAYLGEKINADLTLIPEVRTEHVQEDYQYEQPTHDTSPYNADFGQDYLKSGGVSELPTTSGVGELPDQLTSEV